MAIDFDKTFGAGNSNTDTSRKDQPKAQLWMNVGYVAEGAATDDAGNPVDRFVSLPVGIPVDTQEPLPTNSNNADFRAFQAARNALLEQINAAGANLQPGEEVQLNLVVQLRRVNGEQPQIASEDNKFIRSIDLVAKPAAPAPEPKNPAAK